MSTIISEWEQREIEAQERQDRIEREYQTLKAAAAAHRSSPVGRFEHVAGRLCIRTLRVVCGLVLGGLAWWSAGSAIDIAQTPFARLSLADVLLCAALAVLAFYLAKFAFSSAFGAGPNASEADERMRQQAASNVWQRDRQQG